MADATRAKKMVSEHRRQQNRTAQKRYLFRIGERQKRHMKALEARLTSRESLFPDPDHPAVDGSSRDPAQEPLPGIGQLAAPSASAAQQPVGRASSSSLALGTSVGISSSNDPGQQRFRNAVTADSVQSPPQGSSSESSRLPSLVSSTLVSTSTLDSVTPTPPTPANHRIGETQIPLVEQLDTIQLLNHLMQAENHLGGDIHAQIASGRITIWDILKAGIDVLSQQAASQERPNEASRMRPADEKRPPTDPTTSTALTDKILVLDNRMQVYANAVPDIHANHLSMRKFNTIAAVRANAELLGITFEHFIRSETGSPFYSGPVSKDAAETARLTKFQDVKPHLRPTSSQIRHCHHPYLDVLPFPTFRQRCAEAVSTEPPMIDEAELCNDLEKGGIICWGSYLRGTNPASGSGAPWDMRSWEAQPWFLKKWWFLVGGMDGELFQQSRWWNEMRGDQLPYSW